MKVLLVSPLGFPINPQSKYVGIERLVYEYSKELNRQGHEVTVLGHTKSVFPGGVTNLPTEPKVGDGFLRDEIFQYQLHQPEIYKHDIIHDFSHQHLIARNNPNLPVVSIFWHAPALAKYPKAPYNIISLSRWAGKEFRRVYRQGVVYRQSIVVDALRYTPGVVKRNDRLLALGRMGEEKGNLEAAKLCRDIGIPLDIIAARGTELKDAPLTDYEKAVMELCDGEQIRLLGDVSEEKKIKAMQSCKALLYITTHPEVTSHKIQEAMLCGMKVIAPNLGGIPEIITHGIDGYLCYSKGEYIWAIQHLDDLRPRQTYKAIKEKYCPKTVISEYVELYQVVKEGSRW